MRVLLAALVFMLAAVLALDAPRTGLAQHPDPSPAGVTATGSINGSVTDKASGVMARRGDTGDVNCDRNVDSVDATLVLQYSAGLLGILECPETADVNSDSAVDSIDATLILQFSEALLDILGPAAFIFPVGCELNVECSILYFVDEDPQPGQIQDYACGAMTYDGHTGTDIVLGDHRRWKGPELRDWDLMDEGVDRLARPSTTTGRPDRESRTPRLPCVRREGRGLPMLW